MAYQKLQVGLAAVVIKSDTIDIPLESSQQLSGTTTATTANKLVNGGETFQDYQNLIVGATVVNITDGTIATVTAVDNQTTLSLSADIMALNEEYKIFLSPAANRSEGCILYLPADGNIKVKTVSGSEITYTGVKGGTFLPVQVVRVFSTGTTVTGDIIANW